MDKMKFSAFTWPNNPETFKIRAIREPEYTIDDDGKFNYTGIGPLCREFTGSGVFYGEYAHQYFNTLQTIMATGTAGNLVHPVWGTATVFLTGLEMQQESREGYVAYSFTFREADESGKIPALPEWQYG